MLIILALFVCVKSYIRKKDIIMLKKVKSNIVKEIIKEEEYQKIKQFMNKKDDYFTKKELKVLLHLLIRNPKKNKKQDKHK